jgi:hypothetical protein
MILNGEDMVKGIIHPDGCVPTTWDQDLHYPKEQYAKNFPDNPFISRAEFGKHTDRKNGYPVPYRCFYSKDIGNLFMAGRTISVDRNSLGSTRVMRTCGMMGEVVGKAAWICVRHHTTPRGVYEQYLDILKDLMNKPGAMRRDTLEGNLYLPANAKKLPDSRPFFRQHRPEEARRHRHRRQRSRVERQMGARRRFEALRRRTLQLRQRQRRQRPFCLQREADGSYEVRIFFQPHENRAKTAPGERAERRW